MSKTTNNKQVVIEFVQEVMWRFCSYQYNRQKLVERLIRYMDDYKDDLAKQTEPDDEMQEYFYSFLNIMEEPLSKECLEFFTSDTGQEKVKLNIDVCHTLIDERSLSQDKELSKVFIWLVEKERTSETMEKEWTEILKERIELKLFKQLTKVHIIHWHTLAKDPEDVAFVVEKFGEDTFQQINDLVTLFNHDYPNIDIL